MQWLKYKGSWCSIQVQVVFSELLGCTFCSIQLCCSLEQPETWQAEIFLESFNIFSYDITKCMLLEAQNCFWNNSIFIFRREEVPVISLSLAFELCIWVKWLMLGTNEGKNVHYRGFARQTKFYSHGDGSFGEKKPHYIYLYLNSKIKIKYYC